MTVSSRVPLRQLGQPQSRPLCPFPASGFQAHLACKLCVFASPPQSCLFTRTALSVLYYRPLFVGISPPLASKCCQSEAPTGKAPERVNWSMCCFPTQYLHLSLRGKDGKRHSETTVRSVCPGECLACRRSSTRARYMNNWGQNSRRAAGRADGVASLEQRVARWRRFETGSCGRG